MRKHGLILSFIMVYLASSAQIKISGVVTSNRNEPLIGASILFKQQNTTVITNTKGEYALNSSLAHKITIVFSFLGYEKKEIIISGLIHDTVVNEVLVPIHVQLKELIVSATSEGLTKSNIPAAISVVEADNIDYFPANNIDDYLKQVSNINITRSNGIFSRNASITMRGLNSSQGALIMLNGISLNKSAGGSVNWNMLDLRSIEKIEVIKGPNSALYGQNAMGGTVNIITRKPSDTLQLNASLLGGQYKTVGGSISIGKSHVKEKKGFYWQAGMFYRQGDGYIFVPSNVVDTTASKTYLKEGCSTLLLGYQLNKKSNMEFETSSSLDKRGEGKAIFEKDGSFSSYLTSLNRLTFKTVLFGWNFDATAYELYEKFFRQNESLNTSGKYTLFETHSYKNDYGIRLKASKALFNHDNLTLGVESKIGTENSEDYYWTSTDVIRDKGLMSTNSFFVENSYRLKKFNFILGAREDFAKFQDASLIVDNPTAVTEFIGKYQGDLHESQWSSFSPKGGIIYNWNDLTSIYVNIAKGFNAPILEDMCKSGKITKGFKQANPDLRPEILYNYELGMRKYMLHQKLHIDAAAYYSIGKDFQYFMGTGDSTYTGGDALKPVLKRMNIGEIIIKGFEFDVDYDLNKYISYFITYSYNDSRISKFDIVNNFTKDLTGSTLVEVPKNMVNTGLDLKYKKNRLVITFNFVDKQWFDDENTQIINSYRLLNLKYTRIINKHFQVKLGVDDVLNSKFVDKKGYQSPGLFFMGEVSYKL